MTTTETYPAAFGRAYADYISYSDKIVKAFTDSCAAMVSTYRQENTSVCTGELEREMMAKARDVFDSSFRDQGFLKVMSEFTESYSKLAKDTGYGQLYQSISNLAAVWNNLFLEPLRDRIFRTPSH